MEKKWYKDAYRRNVIDMHITDLDERFLSKFDSKKYVEMLVLSQVKSAVVYAHSHIGNCYYPTKVGHMHKGLKGRNILAEVIDLCHKNNIYVVVYFSLIYDCFAYNNHSDWRIIRADGKELGEGKRYGVCCPNSPYRNYTKEHVEEICKNFDFEGIRFDMTFWPDPCYCRHCQKRFSKEIGAELPKIINWEDSHWVSFQRKREEWLVDFAKLMTTTVKKIKPNVSVEHQSSTYTAFWQQGVTIKLAKENDFLQGDFYGDALQGSFVRKLLYNLSENLPYGFETSICVSLGNHTGIKSKELLKAKRCACLADAGAFVFIDAIDPVGTLNRNAYERIGEIFKETKIYEKYLGGELFQDVAVYLSTESKFNFADNGKKVDSPNLSPNCPHIDGCVNVCKSLIENHIPFGVITEKNIKNLSKHKILILPNVLMMDDDEVNAIKNYVYEGGNLYASKYTSLITKDGVRKKDFLLADIFGVLYIGKTKENVTYIAPVEEKAKIFSGYSQKYPLYIQGTQLIVKAKNSTGIFGTIVLPYTDPADSSKFVSIHSNPPGINTDHPAVVFNNFGKGKVIYVTGDLENSDINRDTFINLLKLLSSSFTFESDAPKSVEITMFHQEEKNRYIINLINFQRELPNIPVYNIKIRVKLDGKTVKQLIALPEEKEIQYSKNGYVEFTVAKLETFLMFALVYKNKNKIY